ncbi:MAG: Deoxyuridine 5'-triphosphate nucleotidohydrolase [Chlamydiales bacterium]|nr:Deoxyuridine 5'-triphosphate nucleotidohydrolase [Chlamydiales bacterium]MCH9635488.1 Deoxyuridine 5'-triphosphate nucleotidohydrolase [Chlamydiales bacterium]MCH9704010.1 dUTP diphosphatase [Chlamydiota bacterium]
MPRLLVKTSDKSLLPTYATKEAAGADVKAAIAEPVTIEPGCSALIPTGLFMQIPKGFEIQIRPRSGLAYKNQVTVLNTPGTIDSDYRGEVGVILINHGKKSFVVEPKMRIAQAVFAPVFQAQYEVVEDLVTSERGSGGFGHTGVQ